MTQQGPESDSPAGSHWPVFLAPHSFLIDSADTRQAPTVCQAPRRAHTDGQRPSVHAQERPVW